jgi:hypothetical protein
MDLDIQLAGSFLEVTVIPLMGLALLLALINLVNRNRRVRKAAAWLMVASWGISLGGLVGFGVASPVFLAAGAFINALPTLLISFLLWLGPVKDPEPTTR